MNGGWIKLHRKLLDDPIGQKPSYSWLWVYLLLIANHEDQDFIWNGERKTVKRGQLLTGRDKLSTTTGIPATTIEDILKYLEKDGKIRQQKTNKFRLISIIKYEQYQEVRQQTDNKPTSSRHKQEYKNDKKLIFKKNNSIITLNDGTKAKLYFGTWVDAKNNSIKIDTAYYPELKKYEIS